MSNLTSTDELKRMLPDELHRELTQVRLEADKMRLAITVGSKKNSAEYRSTKRQIARILTVLSHMKTAKPVAAAPKKETKAAKKPSQAKKTSVKESSSTPSKS